MSPAPHLSLQQLQYRQGTFQLLADAQLTAPITGLFGHSGAGKTTLLELIAGLRHPSGGSMELHGQPLDGAPEKRRIGYVPQDLALFPHQTVRQNLLFPNPRDPARFRQIVDAVQLDPFLDRPPRELSGGEQQRVALGRALASAPRILLLDEPLSSLDAPLKSQLLDLLRSTARKFQVPILYVTHDPAELAALADEILILEHGRITARGTFQQLFQPSAEPHYIRRQ